MAEMRITKVETIVVNMPMVIEGSVLPQQGGRPRTSMDMLLVRVDTDGGVTGWGEGFGHRIFPATKAAIDTLIGPMCVGRDPTAIAALMDELQRILTGVGRNGPAMYALSAIDIALWDIAGKLAGLPLYRLLGGSPRKTSAGLREPAALRRARRRHALHRARAEARLSPHQAARDHRARRSRRRARRPARTSRSWWTATARGRSARRSRWRTGSAVQSQVAGGAGVAAGEPRRAGARAGAGRHPDRGGRERDAARVQGHARGRRDHLRAAERDQGRRRHADAQGHGAGRRASASPSCRTPPTSARGCSPPSTASPRCRAAAWSSATTPISR